MTSRHTPHRPRILWVDSLGGLCVGGLVLALASWLTTWYGLPRSVVLFLGLSNLAYGSFSLSIQLRSERTIRLVSLLAGANMAWLLVCVAITAMHASTMTLFGLASVMGEGLYVAGLGALEWRKRAEIAT